MKIPFRKGKRPAAQETVEISTLEDVFTLISESRQRLKKNGPPADVAEPEVPFQPQHDNTSDSDHESFSTNATMDDNIGTGRSVDKYFYQPAGRAVERLIGNLSRRLYLMRGGTLHVSTTLAPNMPFVESDDVSFSTTSTTSTATNNPGTGRIIDKYIYKVVGKMIERCAGRIAMSHFLTAYAITERIFKLWGLVEPEGPCPACDPRKPMSDAEKVKLSITRIEGLPSGSFVLSGIRELIKRLRSVADPMTPATILKLSLRLTGRDSSPGGFLRRGH